MVRGYLYFQFPIVVLHAKPHQSEVMMPKGFGPLMMSDISHWTPWWLAMGRKLLVLMQPESLSACVDCGLELWSGQREMIVNWCSSKMGDQPCVCLVTWVVQEPLSACK